MTEPLAQRELIRGIARVWAAAAPGDEPRVVGTAMLVAPGQLLTCAHVVAAALGRAADTEPAPTEAVLLDLPAVAPGRLLRARIEVWLPRRARPGGVYDIAGLSLEGPMPEAALAVPLTLTEGSWERPCRVFGFPEGRPDGSYASGSLRDVLANGWVMLRGGAEAREFTRPGYSGGPVYDQHGVLGMLTEGDRDQRVREAVMIPTETLLVAWPALALLHRACPYPGLAPFGRAQADRYFGRREAATGLLAELRDPPHVRVLVGASGSGKSSLLQAGLAQAAGDEWRILDLTPGPRPVDALARTLVEQLQPELTASMRVREVARWRSSLEADGGLADALDELLRERSGRRCLLVLDQCEELFTLVDWPAEAGTTTVERRRQRQELAPALERRRPLGAARFVADLLAALQDPRLRGRSGLVLAVRTDYLDSLLSLPPLATLHGRTPLVRYLGPVDDLREVIAGPLREGGLTRAEAGLVDRLLGDVAGQPHPLPLLAFTLRELWQRQHAGRLTHAAYDALGGVARALAGVAQAFFDDLDETAQQRTRSLLLQLAQPLEGRTYTRRMAPLSHFDPAERALLGALAARRLVVIDADADGEPCAAVAHEALFEHWPALRAWLDEHWEFRRWQEGLRAARREWRAMGEDPDALPRGARLVQGERYLVSDGVRLDAADRDFLSRAIEQREREAAEERERSARERRSQRTSIVVLRGALAVVVALAALAGWSWDQARRAQMAARERAEAVALANDRLAALALDLERSLGGATDALAAQLSARALLIDSGLDDGAADPGLAALLAAQAVSVQRGPASLDALLRTVQRHPRFAARVASGATAVAAHGDGGMLVGSAGGGLAWYPSGAEQADGERNSAHRGPVSAVAVSADGRLGASAGDDGHVRVWVLPGLEAGAEPWRAHQLPVRGLTFDHEAASLATVGLDGEVRVWDVATGARLVTLSRPPSATSVEAGAIAAGAADAAGTADRVGRDDGVPVALPISGFDASLAGAHRGWLQAVAFGPHGGWLAYAATTSEVRFVDPLDGGQLLARGSTGLEISALVALPDGAGVLVGLVDGGVAHVAAADGAVTRLPLRTTLGPVAALALSGDGAAAVVLGSTGVATVVDPTSGRPLAAPYRGITEPPWFVALTDAYVISGGSDGSLIRWHRSPPDPLARTVAVRPSLPTAVVAAVDGRVAVGWNDGAVDLYHAEIDAPLASNPAAHAGRVNGLLADWEAGTVLSAGADGRLVLLSLSDMRPLGTAVWAHDEPLWSIVAAAGGRGFWVGGVQGLAQRWSSVAAAPVERHEERTGLIWTAAPEVHEAEGGRLRAVRIDGIVTVRRDGVLVWSSTEGAGGPVTEIAFDATGERFHAYRAGFLEVRETHGFALRARLSAPGGKAFALDPTGRFLAVSAARGAVQLYDAASLLAIGAPLLEHADGVQRLAFSSDGRWLVVTSNAGEVVVWDVDPERWLARACARAVRAEAGGEWAAMLTAVGAAPGCGPVPGDASEGPA